MHVRFTARGFSRRYGINQIAAVAASHHFSELTRTWIYLGPPPTSLALPCPIDRAGLPFRVTPPFKHLTCSTGILTRYPSPTPFGLGLGPTNPERINLPQETLGFRREGFSPSLSLLMPTVSLPFRPGALTISLQPTTERSPTNRLHPKDLSIPQLR